MNRNPVPQTAPTPNSYIRILHASPGAPAVDVYANGRMIADGLGYKESTDYIPLSPNRYAVQVFPTGQHTNPLVNTGIAVPPGTAFTLALTGVFPAVDLLSIPEVYMPVPPMPGESYVRFAHLSPDTPAVDVALPDGTILFRNVPYKMFTGYIPVNPATYTLQLRPAGSSRTILSLPNIKLDAGRLSTLYAVGLLGKQPPLDVIITADGEYR